MGRHSCAWHHDAQMHNKWPIQAVSQTCDPYTIHVTLYPTVTAGIYLLLFVCQCVHIQLSNTYHPFRLQSL
jgi:hypothetical protein